MPTPTPTRPLDPALVARVVDGLRQQQGEVVETVRTMRFALDDLTGALEQQRRQRAELVALLEDLTRQAPAPRG